MDFPGLISCPLFISFLQEEDTDVKESGDFSKFRLSEETVQRLKGRFVYLMRSLQSCPKSSNIIYSLHEVHLYNYVT